MSTSTVSISSDLQSIIAREMARGDYSDLNDLLRQALSHWLEHRESICAIDEALDEVDAGLGQPWDEVDRQLRAQLGLPLDQ